MKIICMDCQTESHIEVEQLKDKKRFECERCAENPPASPTNQMEEQTNFPVGDSIDFYSVSASESLLESGLSQPVEDTVLEIPPLPALPVTSQSPEMEEIISVPFYEVQTVASEDSSAVFDVNPTEAETFAAESPQQLPTTFVPAVEAFTETPESSNLRQPVEESLSDLPDMPKGVRLMTVKTSILMGVAVVFVLFIALGDKIIRPAGKDGTAMKNSRPVITPEREIKPALAAASAAQPENVNPVKPEPPKPTPTPIAPVVEAKPAEVTTPKNEPPAAAAVEGQFTVQVGSHNDVGQAHEQANKLKAAGFEPRVVSVDLPKRGRWYRVQSGSFSTRAEASRYGAQILAKGAAENFVVSAR